MNIDDARALLNKVKEGLSVPEEEISEALIATGDIPSLQAPFSSSRE